MKSDDEKLFNDLGVKSEDLIHEKGVVYVTDDGRAKSFSKMVEKDERTLPHNLKQAKNKTLEAISEIESSIEALNKVSLVFLKELKRIEAQGNDTCASLKVLHQKTYQTIQNLDKVANFEKLERQVQLLERAQKAMQSLSELEKDGRLARIVLAIK